MGTTGKSLTSKAADAKQVIITSSRTTSQVLSPQSISPIPAQLISQEMLPIPHQESMVNSPSVVVLETQQQKDVFHLTDDEDAERRAEQRAHIWYAIL